MALHIHRASTVIGDVRPESIDLYEWPFAAQPQTDGLWCVFNYASGSHEPVVKDVTEPFAFKYARLQNHNINFRG